MMDLSRQAFLEMMSAHRAGHPYAIAWVWWRKWAGLWIMIANDKLSRIENGDGEG